MKRQSGFTLIELIIVIVILGILAVTVAPQFFNFGSDARASTVRGLEGSIKAASELVHARAQISAGTTTIGSGTEAETLPSIQVRPGVDVVLEGLYAAATVNGIVQALNISSLAASESTGSPASPDSPDSPDWYYLEGTKEITFYPANRDGDNDCSVTYAWDNDNDNDSAPEISLNVVGC